MARPRSLTGGSRGRCSGRAGPRAPFRVAGVVPDQGVPPGDGQDADHQDHARGRHLPPAGRRRGLHIVPCPVVPLALLCHSSTSPEPSAGCRTKSSSGAPAPVPNRRARPNPVAPPRRNTGLRRDARGDAAAGARFPARLAGSFETRAVAVAEGGVGHDMRGFAGDGCRSADSTSATR